MDQVRRLTCSAHRWRRLPRKDVRHDASRDRTPEMAIPRDLRIQPRQHSPNQRAAVEKSDGQRHEEWNHPPLQEAGEQQERNQTEDQPACPNVVSANPEQPQQGASEQDDLATISQERAFEPASRAKRMNNGTVLLSRCAKLPCRNGMLAMPTKPARLRGTTP